MHIFLIQTEATFRTRSFRRIHFYVFKYRFILKDGFLGPEKFPSFRETSSRTPFPNCGNLLFSYIWKQPDLAKRKKKHKASTWQRVGAVMVYWFKMHWALDAQAIGLSSSPNNESPENCTTTRTLGNEHLIQLQSRLFLNGLSPFLSRSYWNFHFRLLPANLVYLAMMNNNSQLDQQNSV